LFRTRKKNENNKKKLKNQEYLITESLTSVRLHCMKKLKKEYLAKNQHLIGLKMATFFTLSQVLMLNKWLNLTLILKEF